MLPSPCHIALHSRRWYWVTAIVIWPFFCQIWSRFHRISSCWTICASCTKSNLHTVHTFPNSTSNHGWVCFVQWGDRMLQPHLWQITHSYEALILGRRIMFLAADKMEGMSKPGLCETDVLVPSIKSFGSFLTSIIISSLCFHWHKQGHLSQSQYRFSLKRSSKYVRWIPNICQFHGEISS